MTTDTTVWRAQMARSNAEQVQAENSLRGERVVCTIRLAMIALMGLSQGAIRNLFDRPIPLDAIRGTTIGLYLLFSVAMWIGLRRTSPDPRKARWAPFMVSLIDVGFATTMAVRTYQLTGAIDLALAAAHGAILLCFSVARMGLRHVAWSTFLSCGMFVGLGLYTGNFNAVTTSFVAGVYIALGLLMARTNAATHQMFFSLRTRDNLSRFLPRQVVDRILKMDGALQPAQREVTVLFSDIRSFTSLSEHLPPKIVLEFLDEYFGHMSQIVMGHDGMVNKFLGDGMLAVWGAPSSLADHPERAVRAALDMRIKLEELNGHWAREGKRPLAIGIGIHTGVVAAGMLGGADQHEYTVIGDAVNVASRVEGLTKAQGVDILITEETYQALSGKYRCERVGEERVKGREKPVVIYAVKERVTSSPVAA
ncbi:MAG: adenylate/guanylate cyclase domain-containing protein [Myxococcota bacterium]